LSELLVRFGAPAVVALIPLLESPDKRISGSAANALSDFGLAARPAIGALGRSLLRGNGWASFALSNTQDETAIPPLVAGALAGEPTAAPALMRMGPAGQRAAAKMLAKNTHVAAISDEFMGGVRFERGDQSALVAPLAAVASDEGLAPENRILACKALGALGKAAIGALPVLRAVAKSSDAALSAAATRALSGIGDPERVPELLARLRAAPRREAISVARQLSTLGPGGREATPLVIERARDGSWEDKVEFIDILASFGDARAVPFLVGELKSPSWRVTMAAVRGLGRMGIAARPALAALEETERKHWLPRIRQYAGEARASIARGGPTGRAEAASQGSLVLGPEVPVRGQDGEPGSVVIQSVNGGRDAQAEWLARRPVDGTCRWPKQAGKAGWKDGSDLGVELPAKLAHLARNQRGYFVTFAVDGGLLVGTDRGEWGGEVVWVEGDREETVTKGNVFAIVPRPWGLVLLQGLAHLFTNDGTASILSRGADGRWTARRFLDLPATPGAVREMPNGGLAIATAYGTVTLDGTGAIQRYECDRGRSDNDGTDEPGLPPAKAVTAKTYEVPTVGAFPAGITVGPDRALWFTELSANKIGRLTTSGAFTEYSVPTPDSTPVRIVAGPDEALWFTEERGHRIGRVTTSGAFKEYPLPSKDGMTFALVVGPDKAIWFTDGRSIGRVTMSGAITEYAIPGDNFGASALAVGPDGAMWSVVEGHGADRLVRVTTAGVFSEYPVSRGRGPVLAMVPAPDGALWFTLGDGLARSTTTGVVTSFPTPGVRADDVAVGSDGALWVTGLSGGIGRMTMKGEFMRYATPVRGPASGVVGPDGALWITDGPANAIVRVTP
jgi:virginiamycin B lyase